MPELPEFNFAKDTAYHFDAVKFGAWLKDNYCLPRGVKHIQEDIHDIKQDDNGIVSLNGKHKADLYVDCTGFKALLLDKTLKEIYTSGRNKKNNEDFRLEFVSKLPDYTTGILYGQNNVFYSFIKDFFAIRSVLPTKKLGNIK